MREPFDIRALAKAIHRRRAECEQADRKVPITPAMSRILEADPDYIPYRRRKAVRRRRYQAVNPAISTMVEIAAALDTTVGALLGERAYRITNEDRRRVLEFVRYLAKLFELDRLQ
jgi:adenylate kinase